MQLTQLFKGFFDSEKLAGVVLIGCTILSLALANTALAPAYTQLWHWHLAGQPLEFWINDGLMTIFFLLVGLEIEREVYIGELAGVRKAMLPVIAAVGGMLVPALLHFWLNAGTPTQAGFGIPMATDIAFSLGILALLGSRVPASLKIFLTALAIIDDLGAILVIALFYSKGISLLYLSAAALLFGVMLLLNRRRMYIVWIYLLLGILLWFCLYRTGIHPTITGVLLAFALPFGNGDERSPSYSLQHRLHSIVAFGILPIFALANTAIAVPASFISSLSSDNSLGIGLGLVIGKPLGIFLFSLFGVAFGLCTLPEDLGRRHLLGAGMLAGIGFTMSIFITLLAFPDQATVDSSKIAVIIASVLSGVMGYIWLRAILGRKPKQQPSLRSQ